MLKYGLIFGLLLSSASAFAEGYVCTIIVDGVGAKSSYVNYDSNSATVTSGMYVCTGSSSKNGTKATIGIPDFGLASVASANGTTSATAEYSEQGERGEGDFHVFCECGLQ